MSTADQRARSRYTGYAQISSKAYDGSAVRRLEREEVLQPRPAARPKKRALARPKIRMREAGKVSPFAAAGFLAIGVFSVLLLMSYVELTAISEEVVSMKSQMETLRSEEAQLRAQYELVYDLNGLEETMLSSGQMIKPQRSQILYVDLSEPDSVTYFQQESSQIGLKGAWESFQSVWHNVVEYFQ